VARSARGALPKRCLKRRLKCVASRKPQRHATVATGSRVTRGPRHLARQVQAQAPERVRHGRALGLEDLLQPPQRHPHLRRDDRRRELGQMQLV
jgi:hypothetical protein